MAHFTPIKGAAPSLQQIDKTCAVAPDRMADPVNKIERGSLIYVDADGNFDLTTAAKAGDATAVVYFALQDQDNYPAGMAGSVGTGPSQAINGFTDDGRAKTLVPITQARITGLSCTMPMTIETDCFDPTDITAVTAVGTALTCGDNGKLVKHATGKNIVGYLDKAPFSRWVNDAAIAGVRRTGAALDVIHVRTAWAPLVATA